MTIPGLSADCVDVAETKKGKKQSICSLALLIRGIRGNLWINLSLKVFAEKRCWGIIEANQSEKTK
jgi:hypothetical protein